MKKRVELLVVGGGPAGLAAASAAGEAGIKSEDILIIERDGELGGILNQCIHSGFGLHTFKEELTGPEYAARYAEKVNAAGIPYLLHTIVVDISVDAGKMKHVTAMNKSEGLFTVEAKAVILAMGCRERSRGALNIPGYRPAGIYSAGTAQRYVNIEGRMPGREVVILGSGDIGLIMARRMTLEGANVKLVAELMPYSGGLKRNIVQCLEDFGIPLKLSHTVIDIDGKERVKGVTVAQVDENRKPITGTEEYISCDTLLLSCGLIPENELSIGLGVVLNPVTSGPVVNESLETNVEGVFACGNVLHVHDLVDYVSEEAESAGRNAAEYILQSQLFGTGSEGEGIERVEIGRMGIGGTGSERAEIEGTRIGEGEIEKAEIERTRIGEGEIERVGIEGAGIGEEEIERAEIEGTRIGEEEIERVGRKKTERENLAKRMIEIKAEDGVRYTVPSVLRLEHMRDEQVIRFRVSDVYRDAVLVVYFNDIPVIKLNKKVMAPGEMEQVKLKKEKLEEYTELKEIRITVE